MRNIEIQLKNPTLTSGDVAEGQVVLTCDDDFKCEQLYVTIKGRELARVVIHAGKVTVVHEEKRDHINHRIDLGENLSIPMGESRYDFSFQLPSNIPGSYEGAYGSIKYSMEAKAEVSWARDPKTKEDLPLAFNMELDSELVPESKSDFISQDGIDLLRAETNSDLFTLGTDVELRFYVDRDVKMRGIRAEIIGVELVEPKGHKMNTKRKLAEIYYPEEQIRRDSWTEIRIPTDTSWVESFKTELIDYKHILKITLDIARRPDKDIKIPIVLSRSAVSSPSVFDF